MQMNNYYRMDRAILLFSIILMILFHCTFASKSKLSPEDVKHAVIAERAKRIEKGTNTLINFMDYLRAEFDKVQSSSDFYREGRTKELIKEIELEIKGVIDTLKNLEHVDKEVNEVEKSVDKDVMLKLTKASPVLETLPKEMFDTLAELKKIRKESLAKYGETNEMRLKNVTNQIAKLRAELAQPSSRSRRQELLKNWEWLMEQMKEIGNNLEEDLSEVRLDADIIDKYAPQGTSAREKISKLIEEIALMKGSSSQQSSLLGSSSKGSSSQGSASRGSVSQGSSSKGSSSSKSKGKGKKKSNKI